MSYFRPHAAMRLYDGKRTLVTRHILAAHTRRHPDVIRRHCQPVACDVGSRALLYDDVEMIAGLDTLPRRMRVA